MQPERQAHWPERASRISMFSVDTATGFDSVESEIGQTFVSRLIDAKFAKRWPNYVFQVFAATLFLASASYS